MQQPLDVTQSPEAHTQPKLYSYLQSPPPVPSTTVKRNSKDYTYGFLDDKFTTMEKILFYISFLVLILCPILIICSFRVVEQYKRAVILRFGKIRRNSPSGPGLIWVHPVTDIMETVDIRTQSINLAPQEILTKDSVTVTVDAVIYYRVTGVIECFMNIQHHTLATNMLALAILRNVLGLYTLTNLLGSRESISQQLKIDLDKATQNFGVDVERVELKDVILPIELQKAMAAEAEGRRLAKAKIIAAEGEIKAAENLSIASQVIAENPKIMLLRYLQTLNYMAADQRSSVLFPFPLDLPDP